MTLIPMVAEEMAAALPWLSAEQMLEVARAMVEDYEIGLPQMMELAGRHLAHLAQDRFFAGLSGSQQVVILAGAGGNGGGALACARRLAAWGANVSVFLSRDRVRFADLPLHHDTQCTRFRSGNARRLAAA